MTTAPIQVQLLHPQARLPQRQHDTDVGWDLFVADVQHDHDCVVTIDFGIGVKPPQGYYLELLPRSSIHRYNCIMANSVGVIDPDYRGSVCMKVQQLEGCSLPVTGERFGQLVLRKLHASSLVQVQQLDSTVRGAGGFGSTGV